MLRIAFDLPFSVSYPTPPFFSTGQDATIVVRLRDGISPEEIARASAVVDLFVRFANLGGLAGRSIEPWRSGATWHPADAVRHDEMSFRLGRCLFDDAGLVALCGLFLHERNVALLRAIEVYAGAPKERLASDTSSYSTYPERFAKIPFEVIDEQPESGAYTFALTLEQPLDTYNQEVLQQALCTWTEFILAGGYALAPIPPKENYVEPDDPFVQFECSLEWSVFKLRAHPASVDALINVLAAFHGRQRRVTSLTIA